MAITAEQVRELRERTGAGMMDCKQALQAADGNVELAIEQLRKEGKAKAAKKSGRLATEGLVIVKVTPDNKAAVILEINSETDFVSRDESFTKFANTVASLALEKRVGDLNALLALPYPNHGNVEQARQELVGKIGENIQFRRCQYLETEGCIGAYVHSNRIGVLLSLSGGDVQLAKDIAMHVAANNPVVVAQKNVSEELIAKEKEIFAAQARESGKPPEIIEKMIDGQISKFLNEVSLLGQPFVKDPNVKVGDLLQSHQAEVESFVRYAVGEGIEKKEENFAEEVMAQVRGVSE